MKCLLRFVLYLSRLVGKPTICICENKDAGQLRGNREADQRLCFRYSDIIVQFLSYLNPKFQASSSFYRPVCVGPVRKPHCWFSHEAAHLSFTVFHYQANTSLQHEQVPQPGVKELFPSVNFLPGTISHTSKRDAPADISSLSSDDQ